MKKLIPAENKKKKKRQYNLTYKARKRGFIINTRKRQVVAYFDDLTKIINYDFVLQLIKDFDYTVTENRQMKIKFKKITK